MEDMARGGRGRHLPHAHLHPQIRRLSPMIQSQKDLMGLIIADLNSGRCSTDKMSQWTPLPQPPSYQSIRELENHRSQTQLDLNHYRQVSSQSRDSNELEAAKRKIQELEQRMANVNQQMQEMRATIHTQSEAMQQPSRSRQGGSQAPIAPYTGPDLITLTPPEVVPPPRVDPPPRVGSPPQAAPPPRVAPPPRFDPGGFISKLAREAAARVRRQTPAPAKTETQARTSEQTMNRASQNGQPRPTAYFPQRFMGHNNQTHRPAHYQEQASINMSHTNQNDQNQQLTYNQEQAANNMNYAGQNNHDRRPTYGQEQSASNLNYATQTNHHRRPTHGQEQGEINMNYVNQNSHNRRPTKNQNHGTSNMDYAVYNQENVQNPLPVPDRDGILRMPDGELIRDLNVTGDASWNKINGKTRSNTSSTINAQSDRYNPSVPDLILPANAAQQGGFRALQMVRDIQGKGPPPSPLHSPKHPSISDANEDFTFCTLFGKFFEMSQQYALTHANFTSTAADAALSPNIKTMLIEICPTEVGSLMSSGQTRCYMVARIINQWVVQHIWNRDVFAGFSQQIDARVKEIGGQIFESKSPCTILNGVY